MKLCHQSMWTQWDPITLACKFLWNSYLCKLMTKKCLLSKGTYLTWTNRSVMADNYCTNTIHCQWELSGNVLYGQQELSVMQLYMLRQDIQIVNPAYGCYTYLTIKQSQVLHTEVEHSFMHTIVLAHTSGMYQRHPKAPHKMSNTCNSFINNSKQ